MSKHPVMYHLTVRQLALSAFHFSRPSRNKPGFSVTYRQWYRVMLILCSIQLMHSFTTLHGGQTTWLARHTAAPIATTGHKTTTIPREKFSFEYDGLLRFRLVITENTGAGSIPAIHIITTLDQSNR